MINDRHFRPPYSNLILNPTGSYFASGQTYDITLDIIVPSSTRNVELGMSLCLSTSSIHLK